MKKVVKLIFGIPLVIILSVVHFLLTLLSMLGAAITTIIAILMYIALAMIMLFQLQPIIEIAAMGVAATVILLLPLVGISGSVLVGGLRHIIVLWLE